MSKSVAEGVKYLEKLTNRRKAEPELQSTRHLNYRAQTVGGPKSRELPGLARHARAHLHLRMHVIVSMSDGRVGRLRFSYQEKACV